MPSSFTSQICEYVKDIVLFWFYKWKYLSQNLLGDLSEFKGWGGVMSLLSEEQRWSTHIFGKKREVYSWETKTTGM